MLYCAFGEFFSTAYLKKYTSIQCLKIGSWIRFLKSSPKEQSEQKENSGFEPNENCNCIIPILLYWDIIIYICLPLFSFSSASFQKAETTFLFLMDVLGLSNDKSLRISTENYSSLSCTHKKWIVHVASW